MADRNQLRVARDYDFTESDPLAELTRIMGFDPRVEPAPPMDDDLGIDLERELMGELAMGVAEETPPPPEADAAHGPGYDADGSGQDDALNADDAAFDDALAASFEEEFSTAVADDWRPTGIEEQGYSPSPAVDAYPAEDAADPDIDIDFSGQLSPVVDEQAAIAGERYLEEHAAADEVPDLEAELGELLSALGAHHEEAESKSDIGLRFQPAIDDAPDDGHAVEAESASLAAPEEFFAIEPQDTSFEASEAADENDAVDTIGAADDGWETVGNAAYSADDLSSAEPAGEEAIADAQEAFAPDEPRDEILDQLFGSAATPTAAHEQEYETFETPAVSEDVQGSAIDFFASSDQELADEVAFDPVIAVADHPSAQEQTAEADYSSSSFEAAEPVAAFDSVPAADELVFDEGEFEAALADEFTIDDYPPEPAGEWSGSEAEAGELPYVSERESFEQSATEIEGDGEDPFAALSSMGLAQTVAPAHYGAAAPAYEDEDDRAASAEGHVEEMGQEAEHALAAPAGAALPPEIETVEVPEQAVALADDLDLPELRLESDVPSPVAYDDLEAEFATAFGTMGSRGHGVGVAEEPAAEASEIDFADDFDRLFEVEEAAMDEGRGGGAAGDDAAYNGAHAFSYDAHVMPPAYGTAYAGDVAQSLTMAEQNEPLSYDPSYDEEIASAPGEGRTKSNRGFLVAAVVAGVAFVGGIGAFAYSLSGGEDGAPALVKADDSPVKVRPENPGGTVVPNQDNKVYERVTEGVLDAPFQEKLISGAEEPIELAAPAAEPDPVATMTEAGGEDLPGVDLAPVEAAPAQEPVIAKNEERIEPSDIESVIANEEIAAVAPRRVRTMIVRPDGTLVPREDPEPVAAEPAAPLQPEAGAEATTLEQPAAPAPALAPMAAEPAEATAQPAVITQAPAATASPAVQPAAEATTTPAPLDVAARPEAAVASADAAATPSRVPVAPSRPGDQPVEIVGEVRTREKLAALAQPEPAAPAAASGWSMQIASQPSAEGAQSTYVQLAGRYGGILGGRSVNIVKAEIADKGTFYRVRIPAESRSDAIDLCERYKAAGGSCFVSQ